MLRDLQVNPLVQVVATLILLVDALEKEGTSTEASCDENKAEENHRWFLKVQS